MGSPLSPQSGSNRTPASRKPDEPWLASAARPSASESTDVVDDEEVRLPLDGVETILREIRRLKAHLAHVLWPKRLMSKCEAAKYLGVSRGRTLDRLIAAGRIGTVRIGGRIKIPFAELERLVSAGGQIAMSNRKAEAAKSDGSFSIRLNDALKRRGF